MSRLERGTIRVFDREFDFFGYEDDTWYQSVKSQGVWTEFTLDHLSQLVAPTDICMDIGANVGTMTLATAICAHKGHVYAFEGSPTTTVALQKTLEACGLGNASAYSAVIGRPSQKVKFFDMPDVRSSGFSVAEESARNLPPVAQSSWNIISTETKSVDQLVRELSIPRVDFMKIDVEGGELEVLAGAEQTLKKFRPKVLLEFNSYALVHLREIIPRHALAEICKIFEEVYYFQDRTGEKVALPKTEEELETFLHYNLLNGCVDDLLCTFAKFDANIVTTKDKRIKARMEDAWLYSIPTKRIGGHLGKRISGRLARIISRS